MKRMQIHQSDFFVIEFSEKDSFLKCTADKKTAALTDAEFIREVIPVIGLIDQYLPERLLLDLRAFDFIIRPQLQRLVIETGLKFYDQTRDIKTAILKSENKIAEVSIEQIVEENKLPLICDFFDDEQEALNWLFTS